MKLLTNKYLLFFLGLLAFRLSFVFTDYLKYIIIFQVFIAFVCLGIFIYEKRKSDFSLIKYALMIFILVDFTFNLSAGHYFLANRKELFLIFDELNSFQSEFFVLLKMLSLTITIFFQNKILDLLAEPAEIIARFSLDIFQIKNMAIDADLQSNLISIDEANAKRNKLNKVGCYLDNMDLIRKLINNKIIISIISLVLYFVLGTLIAVNVNDETVGKAINLSLNLSIVYALYFIVSSFFLVFIYKYSIKEELKVISNTETIMCMKEDCFDKKWNQAYEVFKKYVLKQNDYFTRNDILKACPSLKPLSLYSLIQKSKQDGIIIEKMIRREGLRD